MAGLESADDAGHPQLAQDMAENHRRDDVAAARVEKHDAAQLRVVAAGLEEIDEGLGRVRLDHAVGDDHMGTTRAAPSRLERFDPECHRAGRPRRARKPKIPQRATIRAARDATARLVGGDGLEPPTLSV